MKETVQINFQLGGNPDRFRITGTGGTEGDMRNTFHLAWQIFNANKDKSIGGLLDENVTVFSVKNQDPYNGIADVEAFFAAQFNDGPQFDPTPYEKNQKVHVSKDGLTGTIRGQADWTDINNEPPNTPEVVNFIFSFVYDGDSWWISMLEAKKYTTTER